MKSSASDLSRAGTVAGHSNSLGDTCRRLTRLSTFLYIVMIAAFSAASVRPAAAAARVFDEGALRASISSSGFARVLVRLNAPEITRLADAAFAHKTIIPGRKFSREARSADKSLTDYVHTVTGQFIAKLPAASFKVDRTYDFFPILALDVSGKALDFLKSSPHVSAIIEDRPVPLPLNRDPEDSTVTTSPFPCSSGTSTDINVVGATGAWAEGYTGAGWYVAILDSGVLTDHELFTGKNIVEACFSHTVDAAGNTVGTCPNGQTTMYGTGAAKPFSSLYDGYNHGTHVAGIAVGNGGSVSGVAKGADMIAVQIFSPFPASQCAPDYDQPCVMTWDSDQLAALNYVLSIRGSYPIAAVNMSIGGNPYFNQSSCDSDNAIMKYAVDELRDAGVATVAVSGNDGSCHSLEAPGCISSTISVGAIDNSDQEAGFNDWQYSMLDLLAPGVDIVSSVPDSPTLCKYMSGTSMAAPQITGAWAILKQKDPSATVSDILYALESTGVPVHSLCSGIDDYKPTINIEGALSPYLLPVPSTQAELDYAATDSPIMNMFYLPYPIGVGPIAGTGSTVNVRIGLYEFAGPVDIYVGAYVPEADPDNYYILTPDGSLEPMDTAGLVPWKHNVTGPIDDSLFGEIMSSQLPASTYYVYLMVTPPDRTDFYYLWSTSFVNSGP